MATISFQTLFDLTASPKDTIFTDTTNWAGQSISTADVNGCFSIVSPSGVLIYNNTDFTDGGCDIDIATSLVSQQTILLPLGSDGFPEAGNYVITYTVLNSALNVQYTQVNTVNYQYTSPTVCIVQRIDCISPLFSSVDSTNYTVNSIVPTISGTHTLNYPYGSASESSPTVVNFTATGSVIAVSTFYQGTQTTELVANLTYVFVTGVNGFTITDSISGEKEVKVDCAYICSILCCVRTYYNTMESYRGVNSVEFQKRLAIFTEIMSLIELMQFSINCGLGDEVCNYLNKVKYLSNCSDACSCDSETPSRVIGLGYLVGPAGANGTNGAAGSNGNYITVTAEPAGVNCTYGGQKLELYSGVSGAVLSTNYVCDGNPFVVSAVQTGTDFNTPFTVAGSDLSQDVTGATGTATTSGTYVIIYDADVAISTGASFIMPYRLHKTGGVAINSDNVLSGTAIDAQLKLVSVAVTVLTAGQTVYLNVGTATAVGANINSRSITMLKIA